MQKHGGDIYQREYRLDFSVNVNPLGTPERVMEAACEGIRHSDRYPDVECRKLRAKLAQAEGVCGERIVFGNGAADLIFALALEKGKTGCRHDILVVCGTGKGTSRLLKYKYEQEFSDYLKNIYVCDLLGLESFDMSKVDYIFTTVPITREVTVPIIEVGMFLGTDDIQKITDILRYGNSDGMIRRYYGEKRFIRDVPAGTREEILEYLCRIVRQQEQVDENFYELVLEREAYAQMDYGNYIAIPHPNQIASEESFAYVAVLEKPVVWNDLPVQVVLLVSIGRKEDQDMQRFYETTARFALNKEAVAAVIRNPEYQVFIEMLQR